jgi:hypothetical protein
METPDASASVYSEAKSEYTKQLVFNFQPVLLRFFLDRYAEVKTAPAVVSKTKSALGEFQESLSQIPEWNLDKVQRETAALLQNIHCDYIDDLITAVFIGHTKILSAIRLHAKPRRSAPIQITVPKPDHFMHRTLSECSRILWSNVYLFNDSVTSLERQKNMTEVNRFLEEGIVQAIRNLLPVKSILRDSLQEEADDAIQIKSAPLEGEKDEEEDVEKVPKAPEISDVADAPEAKVPEAPEAPETPEVPKAPEAPETPEVPKAPQVPEEKPVAPMENTLIIDTEKSVGFTGVDSLLSEEGEAELRPMIDEGDNDLKILGDSEDLNLDEFENIDATSEIPTPTVPLSSDDYETL